MTREDFVYVQVAMTREEQYPQFCAGVELIDEMRKAAGATTSYTKVDFIREAIAEKLATLGIEFGDPPKRGGWRRG